MAYEFHYTPTGTGAISGKEVLEQTEDAINDLGNTAISGVREALDKAEQALTNSENAVDDAQTALNTANNAEGVAVQAQNDVSNLSGTVTNIGNRVTTAEGNIGNLQGRMTTAEGNIGNLQGRMTTAEGNIGNLQTAVSTAQATANSAQQTATTARQQSYVFRYSSTALTASSTNSNALLDNTDNLKVGDKVIDSDGVLFSVTAIDTVNSTFTVGTALIDLALDANVVHTNEINSSGIGIIGSVKEVGGVNFNTLTTQGLYGANASGSTNSPENSPCVVQVIKRQNSVIQIANVSSSAYKSRYIRYCADITAQPPVWQSWVKFATDDNVMHLSGDETADGYKTFSKYITSDGSVVGDEHTSNAKTNLWLMSNRDVENVSGILFDTYRQNTAQGTGIHILGIGIKENSVRYEGCRWGWYWDNNLNGYTFDFKPTTQGANQAVKHNLGTRVDKWDTINGLNPGALSLPDIDNRIDISSYITNLSNVNNEYTPSVNGWICIRSGNATKLGILASATNIGNQSVSSTATYLTVMTPVLANIKVYINVVCTSLDHAYFIPCQGNV